MKRVGILTSGGDCQGLNSAIRGLAKGLYEHYGNQVEIYGIIDGYRGLIEGEYRLMKPEDFSGILTVGGTILGTSRQPFKLMRVIDDETSVDKVAEMKKHYNEMKLDCLVVLGGNGTHKSANMLSEEGLNVVSMPKTIDNDIWGTDVTFGFQSAVDIATNVIDCIHTTATSHGRVFIVECMGHKAGWLTLYAGVAGGADVILIPEIPYALIEILSNKNRTKVTEVDLANVWTDEFGVKYSADRTRLLKLPNELKEYKVVDGTKVICDMAFFCCTELISVTFPESIELIGERAFFGGKLFGCKKLEHILVPKGEKERFAELLPSLKDKLVEHKQYIAQYGVDLPEVSEWKWYK